jgi:dipeptidase
VNGINAEDYKTSVFPNRPISLWRTAYASIAQSRASLPDALGAVTWIASNAPHHSSFVPVYASVGTVPETLTNTTQYRFDRSKNYWTHSVIGNYMSRWFKWTIGDVQEFQVQPTACFPPPLTDLSVSSLSVSVSQHHLEEVIFSRQNKFEASALKAYSKNHLPDALDQLNEFQQSTGEYVVSSWWDFFWDVIVSKYRDIYK